MNNISPTPPKTKPKLTLATEKYTWSQLQSILLNSDKPDLSLLRRNAEQEWIYKTYTDKVKKEWKSILDFILHCKFQFTRRSIPAPSPPPSPSDGRENDNEPSNDSKNDDNGPSQASSCMRLSSSTYRDLPKIPPPPRGHVWTVVSSPPSSSSSTIESITDVVCYTHRRVLALNDFPYYFEDTIDHWCLWKLRIVDGGATDVMNESETGNTAVDADSTTANSSSSSTDETNHDHDDGEERDHDTVSEEDITWAKLKLKRLYERTFLTPYGPSNKRSNDRRESSSSSSPKSCSSPTRYCTPSSSDFDDDTTNDDTGVPNEQKGNERSCTTPTTSPMSSSSQVYSCRDTILMKPGWNAMILEKKERSSKRDDRHDKPEEKDGGEENVETQDGTATDVDDDDGDEAAVEMMHWINPPHLMSLPGIDHAHIVVLHP